MYLCQQVVDVVVVEIYVIDDCVGLWQVEQVWFGIVWLWLWSDGVDFDEVEIELVEFVDGVVVFVQVCGQFYWVGKFQVQYRDWQIGWFGCQQVVQVQVVVGFDQVDGQFVGGFWGQFEQQLVGQGVYGWVLVGRMKGVDYSC